MKLNGMALYAMEDGSTFVASIEDKQYQLEDGNVLIEADPDVRGLQLAEYLDGELESANYHSFVGMYEKIYKSLLLSLHKGACDAVFEDIAQAIQIP